MKFETLEYVKNMKEKYQEKESAYKDNLNRMKEDKAIKFGRKEIKEFIEVKRRISVLDGIKYVLFIAPTTKEDLMPHCLLTMEMIDDLCVMGETTLQKNRNRDARARIKDPEFLTTDIEFIKQIVVNGKYNPTALQSISHDKRNTSRVTKKSFESAIVSLIEVTRWQKKNLLDYVKNKDVVGYLKALDSALQMSLYEWQMLREIIFSLEPKESN